MMKMKHGRLRAIALMLLPAVLLLTFTGCAKHGSRTAAESKITIAEQYGLAYAPLEVMKARRLIEKNLPGVQVTWKQLGNTAAIREAMLANEVDAGFMAIPPFLIGWDKGMEWKIACGLSASPVGLVTNRESIKSLHDFTMDDRIAVPQPGSVQHILLAMACEKFLGDPQKLDSLLVTLNHPDGMQALLAGREVTAHFTSPPYLFQELEVQGMRQVLDGKEIMGGEFTFIVGVTTFKLHNDNPEVYQALLKSIGEAVSFMRDNPGETAALLAAAYGMEQNEVLKYLGHEDMEYSLTVQGINSFADFMQRNGYISRIPEMEEIVWENTVYE